MKKIGVIAMICSLVFSVFVACSVPEKDSSTSSSGSEGMSEALSDTDSESDGENATDSEVKEIYYTIQFDTDGGTSMDSVSVLSGEKISPPVTPTKITQDCEYVFIGWLYNGTQWDFENGVVTQDMTLVAEWKEGEKYTEPFLPKN